MNVLQCYNIIPPYYGVSKLLARMYQFYVNNVVLQGLKRRFEDWRASKSEWDDKIKPLGLMACWTFKGKVEQRMMAKSGSCTKPKLHWMPYQFHHGSLCSKLETSKLWKKLDICIWFPFLRPLYSALLCISKILEGCVEQMIRIWEWEHFPRWKLSVSGYSIWVSESVHYCAPEVSGGSSMTVLHQNW